MLSSAIYLESVFNIDRFVEEALQHIPLNKVDVFIGRGISGTASCAILAARTGKKFAVVRKSIDHQHSLHTVEGHVGGRFVFVDDHIATGATLRETKGTYEAHCRQLKAWWRFAGIYLYQNPEFYDQKETSTLYDWALAEPQIFTRSPASNFEQVTLMGIMQQAPTFTGPGIQDLLSVSGPSSPSSFPLTGGTGTPE